MGGCCAQDLVLQSESTGDSIAQVINATGPFSDSIRQMSDPGATKMIMASAGVHVTLPDYYSPEHLGMIVPKTQDGRVVFMLPWLDATIAGTTGGSSSSSMFFAVSLYCVSPEALLRWLVHALWQPR